MPLSTHNAFTIAFLTSIVPAITLLYFTLKEYEKYINDKLMFFSILMGLILGTLVSIFHYSASLYQDIFSSLFIFVMILLFFAIFEGLVKIVFSQLKRFEVKFETTYYAATFGIIVGAAIVMLRTYAFFVRDLSIYEMVGIFIFAIAVIFMNGGTGAWLGYAVHIRDTRWAFVTVILISMPFNFFIFLWYVISPAEPSMEDIVIISAAAIYGILVFLYAYYRILPEALPLKQKRERLRDARKKMKRGKK